ncbi:hypothetical protein ACH5RR_013854 [Cinchona calisaya]|uniref:Uncharacterized protein n=1 Tax=Cinchona calisaya TaxID=153742 RepID=A0ABD3A4V9_9GENT
MATLQKFKLLATQCAVSGSPTRSPSASPVIHLRRRKTLRMLLSRGGSGSGSGSGNRRISRREEGSPDRRRIERDSPEKGKEMVVSHKLRDLFISSPPSFEEKVSENVRDGLLSCGSGGGGGGGGLRRSDGGGGDRSLRPLSATFRQRLLRRAWRPVLMSIPE